MRPLSIIAGVLLIVCAVLMLLLASKAELHRTDALWYPCKGAFIFAIVTAIHLFIESKKLR